MEIALPICVDKETIITFCMMNRIITRLHAMFSFVGGVDCIGNCLRNLLMKLVFILHEFLDLQLKIQLLRAQSPIHV